MSCATPVAFEALVALWAGELAADEAARIEEHVFACDACADAYARLGDLSAALGEVIPIVISHAHRDRLAAAGMRLCLTPVPAGIDTPASFAAGVDLLVHVLKADLADADQVDLDVVYGDERVQVAAVPFDARRGEVLIACQRHYERTPHLDPTFVVHAVVAGTRREVGRYRVLHTWR